MLLGILKVLHAGYICQVGIFLIDIGAAWPLWISHSEFGWHIFDSNAFIIGHLSQERNQNVIYQVLVGHAWSTCNIDIGFTRLILLIPTPVLYPFEFYSVTFFAFILDVTLFLESTKIQEWNLWLVSEVWNIHLNCINQKLGQVLVTISSSGVEHHQETLGILKKWIKSVITIEWRIGFHP